jgi:hypothetical protein
LFTQTLACHSIGNRAREVLIEVSAVLGHQDDVVINYEIVDVVEDAVCAAIWDVASPLIAL